jgi:signal transduction histidine kinase
MGNLPDTDAQRREHGRLSDFLRSRQDEIIRTWTERVRQLSPAQELPESAIVDHLPRVLELVADYVELVRTGGSISIGQLAKAHAIDRLGRGFDFDLIVREYALLRRTILDLWESNVGPTIDLAEVRALQAAFDQAVEQSALRYAQMREKLLKALDRVSEAALTSADLDAFLLELLRATLEGTESVDLGVVLLRDGDVLRVRAAVGLDEDVRQGFSVGIGDGFVGQIAATGRPAFVRDAADDSVVVNPVIKQRGVHALYGVAMARDEGVIGVAHIGSRSAYEFSDEDKLLFRTMVSRATAGVIKAQILADLHKAVAARDQVLAIVSHDLRNQLDVIAMGATILASADTAKADPDLLKPIDAIRRTTKAMERLLRDLLDMASIDAGRLSFEPALIDLRSVLEEARHLHEPTAHANGLQLDLNAPADPIMVRLDRNRILQAIGNILGNSIKFSNRNGRIVLRAAADATDVTISVSDSGPGIDPRDMPRVFEPFSTGSSDGRSGTGLGLYIARGIVARHGGRIWVESEPGKGATFFVALPRREGDVPDLTSR